MDGDAGYAEVGKVAYRPERRRRLGSWNTKFVVGRAGRDLGMRPGRDVGIYPQRDGSFHIHRPGDDRQRVGFLDRFEVELEQAAGQRLGHFIGRLANSGEEDGLRLDARCPGRAILADRNNVGA